MAVNTICLLASSQCNLKCKFCFLHKDKVLNTYNQQIIQAWSNKTYIKNVEASLKKLGESAKNIFEIEFWGGETLLNISIITENVPLIIKTFPNLSKIMFSTNWTVNVENYFNFLKELNTYTNHPIEVITQLSIDGPPGKISAEGHDGWDYYRENLKKFTNLVNNTKLKNIKVKFLINSTVDKEMYLKEFSTYDGIKNFMKYMSNFVAELEELCISESLSTEYIGTMVFPGYSLPASSTVEDGLELAKIIRLWEYVRANEFPEFEKSFSYHLDFPFGIAHFYIINRYTDANLECNEQNISMTFLPDGTQVECSSSYIEGNKEYQQECLDMGDKKRYYSSIIHGSHSINPLSASQEEIYTYNWAVRTGIRNTQSTYLHFAVETCKELALAGQIPKKYYYDTDLLIKHLKVIMGANNCTRENVNITLNPFLTNISTYREYLNGVAEYIYDNRKLQILLTEHLNNGTRNI